MLRKYLDIRLHQTTKEKPNFLLLCFSTASTSFNVYITNTVF